VQTNIDNPSSLETKIRSATKEAIQEIKSCGEVCGCSRKKGAITSCQNCLMREVFRRLHKAGFNIAICKTKWRTSSHIPSGKCDLLLTNIFPNIQLYLRCEIPNILPLLFSKCFDLCDH